MMLREIYFDHASTSYPKPPHVLQEISYYLTEIGVSPGRSSYKRAIAAEEVIFNTRKLLAALLKAQYPHQIIFTLNATHALNIIIKGTLSHGDHVIITNYEHNAVVRPLESLKHKRAISYDIVESDILGNFNMDDFTKKIQKNTKLIIANHGSNVLGSTAPIELIGNVAKEHNVLFAVDGSQTTGLLDIDVNKCNIDFFAFTGHKSLLGPSGTGGFYIKKSDHVATLYEGGTGSNSISLIHPESLPTKFEAGTINYMGIAGLLGSLQYLSVNGIDALCKTKINITNYCLSRLLLIPEIIIYGAITEKLLPIISFNVKNILPQEISYRLDKEYNIMTRSGLQCAPLIHATLQTFPHGTVRVSFGYQNSYEQVDCFIYALKKIIYQHL
ncbi:MAG: aminotransferase class V-fold PLP-dependent enzyme [Candidatus Babeliaceae bacterium]|jgi:cysteine desulfurase family protein